MSKIGFIGLGIMGRPMAAHLIAAGHEVFLHSRGGVPGELRDAGGRDCDSGKAVAQNRAAPSKRKFSPSPRSTESASSGPTASA